jgi:hypothetical protein
MTTSDSNTNGSGFLPEGYEPPSTGGNYMKLKEGDNRVRILNSPLLGWIRWEETPEGKRPVRYPMDEKPSVPDKKHFWAMLIFDYLSNKVCVLEITQLTIQQSLRDFAKDVEWGDPRDYDVTIARKGSGLDTEYSVRPSPKAELTEEIRKAVEATPVHLEALLQGGNPFEEPLEVAPKNDTTPI